MVACSNNTAWVHRQLHINSRLPGLQKNHYDNGRATSNVKQTRRRRPATTTLPAVDVSLMLLLLLLLAYPHHVIASLARIRIAAGHWLSPTAEPPWHPVPPTVPQWHTSVPCASTPAGQCHGLDEIVVPLSSSQSIGTTNVVRRWLIELLRVLCARWPSACTLRTASLSRPIPDIHILRKSLGRTLTIGCQWRMTRLSLKVISAVCSVRACLCCCCTTVTTYHFSLCSQNINTT